jgi:hypothetical protein
VSIAFKKDDPWAILSPIEQSIKAKIEAVGTPLRDWDIQINYGVKTGLNEAFIISGAKRDELVKQDPKSAEIIRPILRGKDIKRNSYAFNNQYVILAYFGSHKIIPAKYPAIYEWLKRFEDKLRNRGQCRYTASGKLNLNAEYPGQHHWLELDNNPRQEYMDDFSKQKIVWADIAKEPTFVTVDEPIFFNNTCYMIVGAPKGLTDILNSKMIEWYFPKIATDIGNGGARYFKQFVELIRVPNVIEDHEYSNEDVFRLYGLTDAEMKFISSSVKP